MTVPCLLSSAQHERNGQALTVIGPVDTLVLIAAMSAPLAWIRVYQGLGMGGAESGGVEPESWVTARSVTPYWASREHFPFSSMIQLSLICQTSFF